MGRYSSRDWECLRRVPRTEREERRGDPYLARHTPIPIQVIRFEGPFLVTRRHHRDATHGSPRL